MREIKIERLGVILILLFSYIMYGVNFILGSFDSLTNISMFNIMKIMYFSGVCFLLLEMILKMQYNHNFFYAKAIGTYILVFSIPTFFYLYTNIIGRNFLLVNILCTVVSVIVTQYFSCKILLEEAKVSNKGKMLSILSILALGFVMFYFSYNPLNTPLFI